MSKELEALEIVCGESVEMDLLFLDRNGENQEKWRNSEAFNKSIEFEKKYGKSPTYILKQALQRLEAIDNAKPSEALDCLEYLSCDPVGYTDSDRNKDYNTIKQALLKQQEPKQYLKWEDLEFSKELKVLNVKMNNNDYILRYTLDIFGGKCCFLYDSARNHHIDLTRQFFNDLHLERVE